MLLGVNAKHPEHRFNNLANNLKQQKLFVFKQHQLPCPSFSESFSSKTPAPDPQEYTW